MFRCLGYIGWRGKGSGFSVHSLQVSGSGDLVLGYEGLGIRIWDFACRVQGPGAHRAERILSKEYSLNPKTPNPEPLHDTPILNLIQEIIPNSRRPWVG